MQYEATLVRGRTYTAFGVTFTQGVPSSRPITEAQKEMLDEQAVDYTTTKDGERVSKPKFTFRAVKDGDRKPKAAVTAKASAKAPAGDENEGEGGADPAASARSRRRAEA